MARPTLEERSLVTRARTLGSGAASIVLSDNDLSVLLGVIVADLQVEDGHATDLINGGSYDEGGSYYETPLSAFQSPQCPPGDFWTRYIDLTQKVEDLPTYLRCLCEIHKRRLKYARILSRQPLPTSDQVAPRALLEYGLADASALASWLTWRKWLFDLDNRAGQETGYLFEPILSAALGGVSFPSSRSPIRRSARPAEGRQVDCVVGNDAYEFKIRVTIAASGQGRWGEELAFPIDCVASGFRPVLVVLDPTPNPKLSELSRAFERAGGMVYIGDEAWLHLEDRAGPTMAVFIERYIRRPVADIAGLMQSPADMAIRALPDGDISLTFSLPNGSYERRLAREVAKADDPILEE